MKRRMEEEVGFPPHQTMQNSFLISMGQLTTKSSIIRLNLSLRIHMIHGGHGMVVAFSSSEGMSMFGNIGEHLQVLRQTSEERLPIPENQ